VQPSRDPPSPHASARARRQLGRVLLVLGALDLTVLVAIIGLLLAAPRLGLSPLALLGVILVGVGAVLATRVWLAVRLHRTSGELF